MFRAQREADELRTGAASDKREIILRYVQRVELSDQCFTIQLTAGTADEPTPLTASLTQVRVGKTLSCWCAARRQLSWSRAMSSWCLQWQMPVPLSSWRFAILTS